MWSRHPQTPLKQMIQGEEGQVFLYKNIDEKSYFYSFHNIVELLKTALFFTLHEATMNRSCSKLPVHRDSHHLLLSMFVF